MLSGQIGVSCLASFVCLPSDLTPYSGCAELPIGDVLMIRVIRQKNGTRSIHATHTQRLRRRSPDQRDNDQPQTTDQFAHLSWRFFHVLQY